MSLGRDPCRGGAASGRWGADNALGARPRPLGTAKGRGCMAKAMWVLPGALGVRSRQLGHGLGPWGCGQDREGTARGCCCTAKAVGA